MLVSELAQGAGVSVATVKYYLREGLLTPGRPVGPRLAEYDDSHLRRLRLLVTLREVGGVPVSALRSLVEAVDDAALEPLQQIARASDALARSTLAEVRPSAEAHALVDALVEQTGWQVRDEAEARGELAALVSLTQASGVPLRLSTEALVRYAAVAERACREELRMVERLPDRDRSVEELIAVGVVLREILTLLRRLAHEHLHFQGLAGAHHPDEGEAG